jgi:hypothetical protein
MKYTEWAVRPVTRATDTGAETQYQVYRLELGGNFYSRDIAESLAFELNKEANGELDK